MILSIIILSAISAWVLYREANKPLIRKIKKRFILWKVAENDYILYDADGKDKIMRDTHYDCVLTMLIRSVPFDVYSKWDMKVRLRRNKKIMRIQELLIKEQERIIKQHENDIINS